jgi:hypothetical protein
VQYDAVFLIGNPRAAHDGLGRFRIENNDTSIEALQLKREPHSLIAFIVYVLSGCDLMAWLHKVGYSLQRDVVPYASSMPDRWL